MILPTNSNHAFGGAFGGAHQQSIKIHFPTYTLAQTEKVLFYQIYLALVPKNKENLNKIMPLGPKESVLTTELCHHKSKYNTTIYKGR